MAVNKRNIFISYRVQDTAGETGRLADALNEYFPSDSIFMDIEKLEPGADFTEVIARSLESCDVMLAVIGPNWLGKQGDGKPNRIQNPNDWVRLELSTALQRNIRVIPVLVDGGQLPEAEDLPPELQPLLRRQAHEISNRRWRYDTEQLINFLINTVGIPSKKTGAVKEAVPQRSWWSRHASWVYLSTGFILAIVILAAIGSQMENPTKQPDDVSGLNAPNNVQQPVNDNTPVNDNENAYIQSTAVAPSVSGTWEEQGDGENSTFKIQQDGNNLGVQVFAFGQQVSSGTGLRHGNNVELIFNLLGSQTVLKATLSPDGNKLSGQYTMEAAGLTEAVVLKRKQSAKN